MLGYVIGHMGKMRLGKLAVTYFTFSLLIVGLLATPFEQAFTQSTTDGEFTPSVFNPEEFTMPSHGPQTIGLFPIFPGNTETVLTGAGHTVINPIDLSVPVTVDVLYLQRGALGISGVQLTNVQNFLANGGIVLTEFQATNLWFDGSLASLLGTNINNFFFACGSCLVTVVDATSPLSIALPATWNSGGPIQFFQVFSGLDPSIQVAIEVLGTAEGDLPVVGCADVGGGTAVLFFNDFLDFFGSETPEEVQLLLNAVDIQSCIPVPIGGTMIPIDSTALLLAGAQMNAAWLIPVVVAGIVIGVLVIKRRK